MSSSWFATKPTSPDAQPDQAKEFESPSLAKDTTEGPKTAPSEPAKPEMEPVVTADKAESEKQHAEGATSTAQPKDSAAVPPTNTQAPVSTPPPASDSTAPRPAVIPVNSDGTIVTTTTLKVDPALNRPDSDLDPEKGEGPEPTGGPAEPDTSAADRRLEWQKRRTLLIHTRLARFFTWILLLGFVILPGTFSRVQNNSAPSGSGTGGVITDIANLPLLAIGYLCCFVNACAICYLWYQRPTEYDWLYNNLFFAGLINAFSGLATTFVNIYAAQDGTYGTASTTTLVVAALSTATYAVLTVVYYQKRRKYQQGRPRSGIV